MSEVFVDTRNTPALPRRVLILDDDAIVRDVMEEIITTLGFDAVSTADGEEMLVRYAEAGEAGAPFALVIMDLIMPGGLGGLEAMQRLLAQDPQVRAIVSSGYAADSIMVDYRRHGFSGVIAKPFRVQELREVIDSVLAE
ncbi:MAG TPA: response regulator [Armatimonadota bacterium]|jgi:CheY-like chemotaxis protein